MINHLFLYEGSHNIIYLNLTLSCRQRIKFILRPEDQLKQSQNQFYESSKYFNFRWYSFRNENPNIIILIIIIIAKCLGKILDREESISSLLKGKQSLNNVLRRKERSWKQKKTIPNYQQSCTKRKNNFNNNFKLTILIHWYLELTSMINTQI